MCEGVVMLCHLESSGRNDIRQLAVNEEMLKMCSGNC